MNVQNGENITVLTHNAIWDICRTQRKTNEVPKGANYEKGYER